MQADGIQNAPIGQIAKNVLAEISVHPNLFSECFTIKKGAINDQKSMEIYHQVGQLIKTINPNELLSTHFIVGNNYKSNIYAIIVKSNNTVELIKILKE